MVIWSSLIRTLPNFIMGLTVLLISSISLTAAADDFYSGKQMRFVIRSEPGGGYDIYSRLIGAHIVRHIPGNPTMLPQNMPGAGGLIAANYMGERAPRDGTYLTMITDALPMDQSLGLTPTLTTDLRSYGWIGNLGASNLLAYTFHTSPTKTMEDAKKRETTIGATGAGSPSTWFPVLFNNVLGTKFKVVQGYKSGLEVKLAMERGEVEAYASNTWSALMTASPELVKNKQISVFVQVGVQREKELPDVPLLTELTTDPDSKLILEFISKSFAVGRPIGTTPGVPPERLALLRKAFIETVADPIFLAAATKSGADISPIDGVTLQALVADVVGAPESLKTKVKAVLPSR